MELPSRLVGSVARWWWGVRLSWYGMDKEPWIFALVIGVIVAGFGFALRTVFAHQDEQRDLACLARNVYYEARGEPASGQLAVAQVTMNRWASGRYAGTLCGVVYQRNWDPIRKRYVGAFSWTELDSVPVPTGEKWLQAWKVAETVYYGREAPGLEGAMFYHATYIRPEWAREKHKIARIGNHVFYR